MWMVFEAPHSPFDPPEPFDRMYDDFEVPDPTIGNWVGGEDEPPALFHQRIIKKADRITPSVMKRLRRHYYAQITHIDYQLGRTAGRA